MSERHLEVLYDTNIKHSTSAHFNQLTSLISYTSLFNISYYKTISSKMPKK